MLAAIYASHPLRRVLRVALPRLPSAPARSVAHARLAPPGIDEGTLVRLTQREGAEDRKTLGKVDHGRIDAAIVHKPQHLLGREL